MRQFNEQIIPGIAQQFASNFGGTQSSGFRSALLNASTDLAERLNAQRVGLRTQGRQDLFQRNQNLRSVLLGARPNENMAIGGNGPAFVPILTSAIQAFGGK
jgi:hypothetical protein